MPILTLTLWSDSDRYSGYELRRIGAELCDEIKKDQDVSEFSLIGGQKRQVRITLDPARLKAYHLSAFQITGALQKANFLLPSGSFPTGNREYLVETGAFLKNSEEVGNVVTGLFNGRPVYLRDVAAIADGPEEPASYVFMGLGAAAARKGIQSAAAGQKEAVTITIAKKKGANASLVAREALAKVEALKGKLIPGDVNVTVTRNYGDTAKEKSDELLEHMLMATIAVIILIALSLGWREAIVVAVAVPVTLALTLLINYLYGYTLNRVTLFALIFSIGILVDDAIVVVENIHRHFKLHKIEPLTAVLAVDEVGNPTILATLTVIAALLPDGLRLRPDGALHAAHTGRRLRRHDLFAARRLHRQPLAELHRPEEREKVGRPRRGREDVPPLREDPRSPAGERIQAVAGPGKRRPSAAAGRHAGSPEEGHGQDAALRQQKRTPGHHRHAGRHDPGGDGGADPGDGRIPEDRSGGHGLPDLCRDGGPL